MSDSTQDTSELQPNTESSKPAAKKSAKKAVKKSTKKSAAKKATKKAAKKATSTVSSEASSDTSDTTATKKAAKKSSKKTTKKAAKKSTKKAVKTAKTAAKAVTSEPTKSDMQTGELFPSDKPHTPSAQKAESSAQQNTGQPQVEQPKIQVIEEKPQSQNEGRNARHGDKPARNHKQNDRSNGDRQQGKKRNSKFDKKNNRNKNRNKNNKQDGQERKPVELTGPKEKVDGMLELAPKGFGFLRVQSKDYEQSRTDIFVTPELIRTNGLRKGVWVEGYSQEGPRGPQLVEITTVNGREPAVAKKFPHFDELKAVNPSKRISFETTQDKYTTRLVDIMSPVGRGQRGLIVSPPRSGKTTLLMDMAEAVIENHEETMKLIVLLIDERPEEVTDFKRRFPDVEIYASSNDSGAKNHCRMADLCIERAKRLVEAGDHVFVLMDSITRLARAHNYAMGGGKQNKGRGFQSGGIVAGALEEPRRLFAAARNTKTAGSLTIVATALIQTNSRADEAIFQEFKGTGNMELVRYHAT